MNNQNWNPQHPQPAQQMPSIPQSKSGMVIAGFVSGIIALLTSFLPIINNLSFVLAILGLIFGIVGMVGISKGKKSGKGLAIVSIVICVVSGAVVLGTQSMYSAALDSAAPSSATTSTSASSAASAESKAASDSASGASSAADSSVSAEYRNALAEAQQYSDMMHMSKQGIYDQLISEYGEKFPADAAQYAIDNVEADWNSNALEKAKLYQDQGSMSKSAIHDQLTSQYGEQFTESEADYAIANL